MRWLLLLLTLPFWFPFRGVGWLRWRNRSARVLHVRLSGLLPDVPAQRGLLAILRRSRQMSLLRVLDTLAAAAADPKLEAVLVQIEHLHCGLARAEELRAALLRVRASGKRVVAYGEELGLTGYWVALGASSIVLPPSAELDVSGIWMEFTLLKGLLDRAGVRAQLLAQGKYKSMREMFVASRISEENREMLASLVDALSTELCSRIAEARGMSVDEARAQVDAGPFRAEEARERRLIDTSQYWDELWQELGGGKGKVERLARYDKRRRREHLWPRRGVAVALLRISGHIKSGHDRHGPHGPRATGSQSLRRALRQLTRSRHVRAVVVRVDSPGGSALASDLMWRELSLAAAKKPTFVSMANVAASGGYYASGIEGVPIWASATTLTGSIGVVGGKFDLSGLLDKLGIAHEAVASGPRAGFRAPTQPWNEAELQKVERDMAALYRDFVTKMAAARGMSFDAMHAVAQGRVWTGRQAQAAGLLDHLGGLHDVEQALRERLGIAADVRLRWVIPSSESVLRPDASSQSALAALEPVTAVLPELANALEHALDLSGERLWALCPIQPRWARG